jgi:N-acyl-D-amino-acid deacylase
MKSCVVLALLAFSANQLAVADPSPKQDGPSQVASTAEIRDAVDRSLPLLEIASAGSADNRTCFTCHSQALPVFAFVEADRRGLPIDAENLGRQIEHTHSHLQRGRQSYDEGRGQGGGVDTAGYALWTLEVGGRFSDDVSTSVTQWLLKKQDPDGFWKRSSNRPPSEASNFTSTYLALRALAVFGTDDQSSAIAKGTDSAVRWAVAADANDTEDQVFRLLTFTYGDVPADVSSAAVTQLKTSQRDDGGWAQKPDMESDAYATATVLYALRQFGAMDESESALMRAIRYLLDTQLDDGSWRVKSRSDPFQPYFETGFPHKTDQFISTTASAWATIALLDLLPTE